MKRKRQYEMGLEEGWEIGLAVPTGCNETSPLIGAHLTGRRKSPSA